MGSISEATPWRSLSIWPMAACWNRHSTEGCTAVHFSLIMDWTVLFNSSSPLFKATENIGVICSRSISSMEPRSLGVVVKISKIPMFSPWYDKGEINMERIPMLPACCSAITGSGNSVKSGILTILSSSTAFNQTDPLRSSRERCLELAKRQFMFELQSLLTIMTWSPWSAPIPIINSGRLKRALRRFSRRFIPSDEKIECWSIKSFSRAEITSGSVTSIALATVNPENKNFEISI